MKIFHISDTHVGDEDEFNEEAFNQAISEANSGKYDILVHAGDVTQNGKPKYYKKAKELFRKIEIPYIIIPGNHDKRSGGFSLYKEYIGEPQGVREFDDAVIVSVDSAVPDTNIGRVGMIKFDRIKEALNKFQDKPIKIVILHHHVIPVPRAGKERNVLSDAGDLLELFLKADVDLVLGGHRHHPNVHKLEDTVFVNAGTVSGEKTRHGDANSYCVEDIDKDEISVETRKINGEQSVNNFSRKRKRVFYNFGERKIRVAHIANTFISSSTESPMPNTAKFRYSHFFNSVDYINESDVDLVVHCGGIVEEGISKNYDLANQYLAEIDPPIIFTPAGRDINYLGYHLFQEYFGRMDQTYVDENFYLQGISSAQYDSPVGIIGGTELDDLFERINEREEAFKGIFLHHNVVPIPHSREKGLLEDSGNLLRRTIDEELDLVLTGTSSHPFSVRVGKTVVANANSLSSVYQRSTYGNSFNLIDVYENAIVVFEINSLWGNSRLVGIWPRN